MNPPVKAPVKAMDKTFEIGGVRINPPLALAPMAEVTDTYYRSLVKELGGVGLVVSEFISSEGLTRKNDRSHKMLLFEEHERPVAIQIYGGDPDRMDDAAAIVEQQGVDIVDINMGCPVPKIAKHNAGCSCASSNSCALYCWSLRRLHRRLLQRALWQPRAALDCSTHPRSPLAFTRSRSLIPLHSTLAAQCCPAVPRLDSPPPHHPVPMATLAPISSRQFHQARRRTASLRTPLSGAHPSIPTHRRSRRLAVHSTPLYPCLCTLFIGSRWVVIDVRCDVDALSGRSG